MLELILIISLSMQIAGIVKAKSRSPAGYIVLLVVLWRCGEFAGSVAGLIVCRGTFGIAAYLFALLGAAVGIFVALLIAKSVSNLRAVDPDGHVVGFPVILRPSAPETRASKRG
jgi:hypothetical protein